MIADVVRAPDDQSQFDRFFLLGRAIDGRVAECERAVRFDREGFRTLGEHGLFLLTNEASIDALFAALEGLAAGCDDAGFVVSCVAHAIGAKLLHESGRGRSREALLPRALRGEALIAVANAEPDSGTDVLTVRSTLRRRDGVLTLDARKRSITNMGCADIVLVSARDADAEPSRSLQVLALDAASRGLYQRARTERLGLRTSPTGDLVARRVLVEADAVLDGGAISFFRRCFALERLLVSIVFVAAMRRALRRSLEHLALRPSLAAHQRVQDKVVEARSGLAVIQALLHAVKEDFSAGRECDATLSVLKSEGAERAYSVARSALDLVGAKGYGSANGLEKDLRDLLGLRMLGGTTELHRSAIYRAAAQGR